MIIAVSSEGKGLDSKVDSRFGRAAGFVFYNSETGDVSYAENSQNLQAVQGAGIQSAQHILNAGADVLLTSHVGPKAFKVLKEGDVAIYSGISGTVQDAIDDYKNNKLQVSGEADVDGHW